MIDRKALRIFVPTLFAMIAATVWRLSLLPDGRLPAGGPGNPETVSGLFLFAGPASLLLMLPVPCIQWLASPEESRVSWKRWNSRWIVSWSVFWAILHGILLAHSLGLVSLSHLDVARGGSIIIGVIFMLMGNAAPKAPPVPQHRRSSFQFDSWQASRMLRFGGKLLVGLGFGFVFGGILLPFEYWQPVFLCLMLAAFAAGILYSLRLRQERPVQ